MKLDLAKRLSQIQKEEIAELFIRGESLEVLSKKFNCMKSTIIRNLKKMIGVSKYQKLSDIEKAHEKHDEIDVINKNKSFYIDKIEEASINDLSQENHIDDISAKDLLTNASFLEIPPMDYQIENSPRKEISSVPIAEIDFPKVVYMVVDKKIELEIKLLKDYPEWGFMPNDDLQRKTIEIYFDLKNAKRSCNKEQKVIKVPNCDVFRIVSPILLSRGISRIVTEDQLIAL